MSIFNLLKREKKKNKFLVIELDNNQIKVLVLYKNIDNQIKIIGSSKNKIPENIIFNLHIIDKKAVINSIQEAVMNATNELEENIEDVIFGVKGMQCLEITTTAKSTSTHKRLIKENEIYEVYDRITEAAYMQAQNDLVKMHADYDSELEIILTSNVYNKVDNSLVEDPIGVEGEILECALFNALCYKKDIKTIKNLMKACKLNLIAIAPIAYSIVQNISKSQLKEKSDYSLVNISKDSTELIIVFGGGLIDKRTIPIGFEAIKDSIANMMGLTNAESEKLILSYLIGKLKEEDTSVLQKVLKEVLYSWIEGLKVCYEDFSEIKTYASQIYITGEGSLLPDVKNMFNNETWFKEIPFKKEPTSKKLNISDFSFIQDSTGKVDSPIWITTQSLNIIYLEQEDTND